jgi:hypothetical protein
MMVSPLRLHVRHSTHEDKTTRLFQKLGHHSHSDSSKTLEWVSVSIGASLLGNIRGCSFLRAFEIKRYIMRYVKMPCKWIFLSIGAPFGNLEGIHLPGLLQRK